MTTRGSATSSGMFFRTSKHGSGTQATCIPAASPALTPLGESSITRQRSTLGWPRRRAASTKQSGAGFPFLTDGSSPTMMWSKLENNARWFVRLTANIQPDDPVARPRGISIAFNAATISNAPGRLWHSKNTSFCQILLPQRLKGDIHGHTSMAYDRSTYFWTLMSS